MDVGEEDLLDQRAMKLERGTCDLLSGPVFQAFRNGQRQLPDHRLEPHPPDQHAHNPGADMYAAALRWVLLPVAPQKEEAAGDQRQKQHDQQIAPSSEQEMVLRRPGQEAPEISQRVLRHGQPLFASADAARRSMPRQEPHRVGCRPSRA